MSATVIDLEPAELQTIADAFELGTVSATKHTGKVYALHSTRGLFALRFSNTSATPAHLLATHRARTLLADAGLPVVSPLRTAGGTTIVEAHGLLGDIQPWIAHTDDGGSWERLAIAAQVLPRFHAVLTPSTLNVDQRDDPWQTPAELIRQLGDAMPTIQALAREHGIDVTPYLHSAMAILEQLHTHRLLDQCPRQLTHGDFQGPNLLFQERWLSGIIDFERLEYRPRLYDLAWPLVFWRWFGTDADDYTERDWQSAHACCAAYARGAPVVVTKDEWATLPLLMAYIPARGIAEAGQEEQPLGEILAFGKALAFAESLVQHPTQALQRLRA
jgi:Ser/Thr protein kinase RdoA (MazF antagonist)